MKNQRQYTFFVYLNDVENGGETVFPKLNLSFKPQRGLSLFWENCKDLTTCDELNLHKGNSTINGIKYGLNIWVNFKSIN